MGFDFSLYGILGLLLYAGCIIHAIRTGRINYWLFILIFIPGLGSILYLLFEVLPGLRHSHTARRAASGLGAALDPNRRLRESRANLEIVDQAFIDQFVATYEALFIKDPSEFTTYVDFSAAARRVYSRWKREIPLLGRTGELLIVTPKTGEIRKGKKQDYPKIAPFDSEKNYRAAIKDEGGEVPKEGLRPA
jgi:hypothetical protein